MPVQYCFKHVWNILRLSLVSSSSSGLRLRRWSTTESGRRTGEPKTGPRVQRARRQPRLRRRPARLQRPRVLVRTPERNFTLKCTNPIFLFSSHRVVEVTLSTLLPLFDACSVSPVCCAAFYGLSSKTMKPNPSERKTRRKSRMSEWVPAVAVTAVVPGCSCRPLLDFLWQPFLHPSKYSLHHLVFKRSLQNSKQTKSVVFHLFWLLCCDSESIVLLFFFLTWEGLTCAETSCYICLKTCVHLHPQHLAGFIDMKGNCLQCARYCQRPDFSVVQWSFWCLTGFYNVMTKAWFHTRNSQSSLLWFYHF